MALYGVDRVVLDKGLVKASVDALASSNDVIRDRGEPAEQIGALSALRAMALSYGCYADGTTLPAGFLGPVRQPSDALQL